MAEESPAAINRSELRAHLRRRSWRKTTAPVLLSWLGLWMRRGWDAQGCGVELKKGGPLVSACVPGWRSAEIAAAVAARGRRISA